MGAKVGALVVRRSIWIDAKPDEVWHEFESFERMRAWYGTGHTLVRYEPFVGGVVETDASSDSDNHGDDASSSELRFVGKVVVFEPGREVTFEQDWLGHGWIAPPLITIRLTEVDGGTLVELMHHGFEALGTTAVAAENHEGFEGGWTNRQLVALRARVGS
jgi:uncharacterized protein YndB with AHSA1/START domain